MNAFKNQMLLTIDKCAFFLRVRAPQNKDQPFALIIQQLDDFVGELFPTAALMSRRLALLDGQYAVQKQNALIGPTFKIAIF